MKAIEWASDDEFRIDNVNFLSGLSDYSLKTDENRFVILKNKPCVECYLTAFGDWRPHNILEFGIFQGGSPALLSLLFEVKKFVGIDLCEPVAAFDAFCAQHPVGRRIRSYYRTSQTDRDRIEAIVRAEFCEEPVDLIIDDASHLYKETKKTFEITFPHLRPGGFYVIEDWGWAHWPGSTVFEGETAMSLLIMELIMLCASRADLINDVRVFPPFTFVRKSPQAPAMAELKLDQLCKKRGIELLGQEDLNPWTLTKLFAKEMGIVISTRTDKEIHRWRRRLKRRTADDRASGSN